MLDHQRDLWADFRAIYGLAPAEALALSGPEYLALAYRTPAYEGAMRVAVQRQEGTEQGRARPAVGRVPEGTTVRDVPLGSKNVVGTDGVDLSGLIEFA